MSAHSAPGEGTVHGRLNAPMATAHDPALLPDTTPPSSVQGISFPEILPDRLTIRWAPASDDVGIAAYRIWLDGFQLADTTALQVTLAWFRDGSRQQVVQIRAVDAAGNLSEQAPPVLVARPTGTPTSPSGAGEPVATGSPSATADPTSATATIASPLDGDG